MACSSYLLLAALALWPGCLVEGLTGCGTTAEVTACKNAYQPIEQSATKTVAEKCVAVAVWMQCMTPAATCTDATALARKATEISGFKAIACTQANSLCKKEPVCIDTTTTVTPWDSSYSSGSGDSLKSSYSKSLYTGSSGSDSSGSARANSSGSKASGSSGSFLEIWQWALLLLFCCCCCGCGGGGAAMAMKKKPKKKSPPPMPEYEYTEPEPPMPVPELLPEPVPEVVEPLIPLAAPALVPTSTMQWSPTTAYSQPVTTGYAMPATASYAMPAPVTTGVAGYGGYPYAGGSVV